jgi:excisionase family DNA binding protein
MRAEMDSARPNDGLWTVKEVARYCKIPESWLYERTRPNGSERIPHIKLGKYIRFEKKSIMEYLAARRVEPSNPQPKGRRQVVEKPRSK